MKPIRYLLMFLALSAHAQRRDLNNGLLNLNIGNKFEPAEVVYADGTLQKGFINGFIESNTIEFGGFSNFDSFEGQLNLDDKKFSFKEKADGKSKTLYQKDIKAVTIFENGNRKTYRLLDIGVVGKNLEIKNLGSKAWLPVLREDSAVTIYGFNMLINGRYVHTYVYLSKDNMLAIKPTSMKAYAPMLTYVFDNCEKMIPLIDDFTNIGKAKAEYKRIDAEIKLVQKDKTLAASEKEDKVLALQQSKIVDPYVAIIGEYKKLCAK